MPTPEGDWSAGCRPVPRQHPSRLTLGQGSRWTIWGDLEFEETHGSQGIPQPLGHVLLPAHILALIWLCREHSPPALMRVLPWLGAGQARAFG